MSVPVKIAIAGASGRMGRMLIEAVLRDPATALHAAFEREGSEKPVCVAELVSLLFE